MEKIPINAFGLDTPANYSDVLIAIGSPARDLGVSGILFKFLHVSW